MKVSYSLIAFVVVAAVFFTANAIPMRNYPVDHSNLYSSPKPAKRYAHGKIIDISHQIRAGLPKYDEKITTNSSYLQYLYPFNLTTPKLRTQCLTFNIPVHTSTHVDAPSHAHLKYERMGFDVDTLDLATLNGPALVVEVPKDKNITAEVLQSLNIPKSTKRVLFKTANTDRNLMWKPFESNYTGFTVDGAQWIVNNSRIKLIGVDYLSVAIGSKAEAYVPPHKVLLEPRDIIPVEGLNLLGVKPGRYNLHCLPLRLLGADGAPTRCILYTK